MTTKYNSDTIAAVASGTGGAIALIRVSGDQSIEICNSLLRFKSGKTLSSAKGYTLHYGHIVDGDCVVDDVMVSLFRSPHSYTGEDMVEISCHGSNYIQQYILNLLIKGGARVAEAGEFTVRAFLAGKLDLSQAEAIADMIASTDRATHTMATQQLRGGYSLEFSLLRDKLVELISLLELELDFSEEDVEFADRTKLVCIVDEITTKIEALITSFSLGNVLKEGVSVVIVGSPNAGKSTLLNSLLNEDRAMVSDIAGTTRDVIEESITIDGVKYRFLDTAGIRETADKLEQMGIDRTFSSISKAQIVVLLLDAFEFDSVGGKVHYIESVVSTLPVLCDDQHLLVVLNKCDLISESAKIELLGLLGAYDVVDISAKSSQNIDKLLSSLSSQVDATPLYSGSTILSNGRHYDALYNSMVSLSRSRQGLVDGISGDLLAQDLRESLYYLGVITGEITTDDILGSIFSKFCIGK